MIELKGTHGTCASFAEEILKNGFTVGAGRRGVGVYFWGYSSTNKEYATALANAWWAQAKVLHKYDVAHNKSCRVLYVSMKLDPDSFLDLEAHEMKQRLLLFLNDIYMRTLAKGRPALAEKAYDLFVGIIEKELKVKFEVVYVTVNPPQTEHWAARDRYPSFDVLGMASCYVVKNKRCILQVQ